MYILGLYGDNGKENGNYYLGFRLLGLGFWISGLRLGVFLRVSGSYWAAVGSPLRGTSIGVRTTFPGYGVECFRGIQKALTCETQRFRIAAFATKILKHPLLSSDTGLPLANRTLMPDVAEASVSECSRSP